MEQQQPTSASLDAQGSSRGSPVQDEQLIGLDLNKPQNASLFLAVSEVFGPTFQGEGRSVGRRCVFLRLGGCNLKCSWCDTAYTWDWARYDPKAEVRRLSVGVVIDELDALTFRQPDPTLLVVSGGEPMLQQRALKILLDSTIYRDVEIETNGTVALNPDWMSGVFGVKFNISPKLAHSGNGVTYRTSVLKEYIQTYECTFKFVVREVGDLNEVDWVVDKAGVHQNAVYIMAEGVDPGVVRNRMVELAPHVIARGWNMTPRMHINLWGDKRGR